jgi:prevent-host-death family protein
MRSVGAREANQQFSRLLKDAEGGEHIVITRNGKAVAQLSPARQVKSSRAQKKAVEEMIRLMKKGLDLGGKRFTRDEMHDD